MSFSLVVLCPVILSNLLTEELLGDKFFELAKTFVVFVSPFVSVIMSKLEFEAWF